MHSLDRQISNIICLILVIISVANLKIPKLWAAGKKRSVPCGPQEPSLPQFSTPSPVRNVILPQIGTKVFQMPNGITVDLNADLQTILITSVSSAAFSPTDPNPNIKGPCDVHLELRSAVTTFQLDVVEAGVSFGFNPAGVLKTPTNIAGEAKVKVGLIAMDFSLWQCKEGYCSAVTAATSNHLVVGSDIIFNINFGAIKAGAELIVNPVLSSVIRSIMNDAMKKLISSPLIPNLPWTSQVRDFDPATGTLIFDDGDQAGIRPNQTFIIYAPTDDTPKGVCNVFQPVAFIHTTAVFPVSSEAIIDKILDTRGVKVGDVVMIRRVQPPAM